MKLIRMTDESSEALYINPDHVAALKDYGSNLTLIYVPGHEGNYLVAVGKIEDIARLLLDAANN